MLEKRTEFLAKKAGIQGKKFYMAMQNKKAMQSVKKEINRRALTTKQELIKTKERIKKLKEILKAFRENRPLSVPEQKSMNRFRKLLEDMQKEKNNKENDLQKLVDEKNWFSSQNLALSGKKTRERFFRMKNKKKKEKRSRIF